ncbi:GIY-YIG nuclease family protein [Flavobacterium sp. NST-5]|uniref:GIY-YIG nuclease family protein n=1 Tax=Flavobacterium ichthyis TaxID=2698827 RepID=A0ABW9Z610_9FLAO|nr:exonuclease domain-containing protein [Flavobacterium ichthyis]NBL64268.1 GIY-YIG nuclease family protein [Flavobacterium ichthyis]
MYTILDIETTGGQFNEEGITEIAIYKFDGHEIVDQFISLVNPEKPIQPFVVKLTGINNAMLQSAPKFYEVAKRIIEITQDTILVAHNAQFDYRILRTEFSRLGYDFERHNICTVELAKKLIPEQPSYSLGKLVRALGIPMADRHRASGDALATAKLFKILLDKDLEKEIVKSFIKTETEKKLPQKFLEIVAKLPSTTGIYYIHNQNGEVIYIGKSRNIKKRVNQHFTSQSSKSKKIQQEVFEVTYEETGSELIALLKESEEIKINKPKYNRSQKKVIFPWSIYSEFDKNGYLSLTIQPTNTLKNEVISFASQIEARNFLFKITDEFQLCQKINKLDKPKTHCFPFKVNQCFGACVNQENPVEYNNRVNQFLQKNKFHSQNLIIVDRGRNLQERSAILLENGIFNGIAYFELNYQVSKIDILKNIIVKMEHTKDAKQLILNYISKNKVQKIIHF